MVKHIVMWRINPSEGQSREQTLSTMRNALNGLPAQISVIKGYEVGVASSRSPSSYDIVLISAFDSWEDLKAYRDHPEHVKVKDYIAEIRTEAAVVDYEI